MQDAAGGGEAPLIPPPLPLPYTERLDEPQNASSPAPEVVVGAAALASHIHHGTDAATIPSTSSPLPVRCGLHAACEGATHYNGIRGPVGSCTALHRFPLTAASQPFRQICVRHATDDRQTALHLTRKPNAHLMPPAPPRLLPSPMGGPRPQVSILASTACNPGSQPNAMPMPRNDSCHRLPPVSSTLAHGTCSSGMTTHGEKARGGGRAWSTPRPGARTWPYPKPRAAHPASWRAPRAQPLPFNLRHRKATAAAARGVVAAPPV